MQTVTAHLRLLATDGSLVPVSASAEILLLGPHDLLESAYIGPVMEGEGRGVTGRETEPVQ